MKTHTTLDHPWPVKLGVSFEAVSFGMPLQHSPRPASHPRPLLCIENMLQEVPKLLT
jgi:hypothetical protein